MVPPHLSSLSSKSYHWLGLCVGRGWFWLKCGYWSWYRFFGGYHGSSLAIAHGGTQWCWDWHSRYSDAQIVKCCEFQTFKKKKVKVEFSEYYFSKPSKTNDLEIGNYCGKGKDSYLGNESSQEFKFLSFLPLPFCGS